VSEVARESGVWYARRNGRRVALLRCLELGDAAQVECEVYREAGDDVVDTLRPGPYRFPTAPDALRFVGEAVLALEYLGCDVA